MYLHVSVLLLSLSPLLFLSFIADKTEEKAIITEKPLNVKDYSFLLVSKNLTWFEALEYCKSKSMYPASIPDAFVQSVLGVNVNRVGTAMWIGLFSEDVSTLQFI